MWAISTVFLLVAIGFVSAVDIQPSLSFGNKTLNSSSTIVVNPTSSSAILTTAALTTSPVHNASSAVVPTSTHSVPTPSSSATNATTPKPTTKPTTKPATTTPAPLHAGDYSVKGKDGKYCLLAQMNATFVIMYEQNVTVNTTKEQKVTKTVPFKTGSFNTSGSKCSEKTPLLKIRWGGHYDFELQFEQVTNTSNWQVTSLKLTANTVNNPDFKNATEKMITMEANQTELHAISAGVKGYYACAPDHVYDFNDKKSKLYLDNVKLQPYVHNTTKKENFGEEFNCEPKPTPKPDDNNIVPIAVGCALAGLVLIVLIAYIIGRRKSQRGYEKV